MNPAELFAKIDQFRIRAEVEERTEVTTIHLVGVWLRSIGEEKLAVRLEAGEWMPKQG